MTDTSELIKRLKHLVSLNEPRNGGPYQGVAAVACVQAYDDFVPALLAGRLAAHAGDEAPAVTVQPRRGSS